MAVKNTEGYDAKGTKALYQNGDRIETIVARMEVAAADADTQTYILARGISLDWTLVNLMIPRGFSAITSGTDYDIGLGYIGADGEVVVVEADVFVDGKNMSAGATSAIDICESPTDQTIGECLATPLTSENERKEYVIYCTANTVGSATVDVEFNINVNKAH